MHLCCEIHYINLIVCCEIPIDIGFSCAFFVLRDTLYKFDSVLRDTD